MYCLPQRILSQLFKLSSLSHFLLDMFRSRSIPLYFVSHRNSTGARSLSNHPMQSRHLPQRQQLRSLQFGLSQLSDCCIELYQLLRWKISFWIDLQQLRRFLPHLRRVSCLQLQILSCWFPTLGKPMRSVILSIEQVHEQWRMYSLSLNLPYMQCWSSE